MIYYHVFDIIHMSILHEYIHMHSYSYINIYEYVHKYVSINVCIYVCMCVCLRMDVGSITLCVSTCIFVYQKTYITYIYFMTDLNHKVEKDNISL